MAFMEVMEVQVEMEDGANRLGKQVARMRVEVINERIQ